jgi:hypothetical protein
MRMDAGFFWEGGSWRCSGLGVLFLSGDHANSFLKMWKSFVRDN